MQKRVQFCKRACLIKAIVTYPIFHRVIRDADSLAEEEERPQAVEPPAGQTCEAYLEVADSYEYSRDYWKTPIVVQRNQDHVERTDCDLGCHYTSGYALRFQAHPSF